MKRQYSHTLICILCVTLLVAVMVSPVSAASSADYESNIVNYYDYNEAPYAYTANSSNDYTVTFPLHREMYIRYVDLLIGTGHNIYGASVVRGTVTTELTMVSVGNGYYRFYGEFGGGKASWDTEISFVFDVDDSGANIQVMSFQYSIIPNEYWLDIGTIEAGTTLDPDDVTKKTMANKNTPAVVLFDSQPVPSNYFVDIYTPYWRKYDQIDFLIGLETAGVNSIGVDLEAALSIPFTVSYLDSSGNLSFELVEDVQEYYAGKAYYTFPNGISSDWIQVHIDVSKVNKSVAGDPVIRITGPLGPYEISYAASLISVTGTVAVDNQSPLSVWFNNIKEFFRDLFNPDDGVSSDTEEKMDEAGKELDKIGNEFDQIDTPDIDTGNLTGNFTKFSTSGLAVLGVITNNGYVTSLLVLIFTFALVAYIFFGKR